MNRKTGAFFSVFLSAALLFTSGCSLGIEKVPSQSSASSSGISSASVSSFDMATKIMETEQCRFELPETWDTATVSGEEVYLPKDTDLAGDVSYFYVNVTPGNETKLSVNYCKTILLPELRKKILETYPNAQDFIYFDYQSAKGPVFVASSKVEKGVVLSSYFIIESKDTIIVETLDCGNSGAIRLHDVAKHAIDTIEVK